MLGWDILNNVLVYDVFAWHSDHYGYVGVRFPGQS